MKFKNVLSLSIMHPAAICIIMTLITACASIPKESVEMSATLDRQLLALESANIALINNVYAAKEAAAVEYLDNVWFPNYLDNYFANESVQALWEYVLNSDNPADRTEVTSFLTKTAIEQYSNEKAMLLAPIAAERDSIISIYAIEYEKARQMNDAIGKLLESEYEVKKAYGSMLPEGKAERLDSVLNSSLSRLDSGLRRIKASSSVVKNSISALRDSLTNNN